MSRVNLEEAVARAEAAIGAAEHMPTQWGHRRRVQERTVLARDVLTLVDEVKTLRAIAKAARSFRIADTGGGFNDRVECGRALDAALRALDAPKETP